MDEKRTDIITLKTTPTLKKLAAQKASEEGRTLSNYIEQLILKDLKKTKGLK